MRNKAMCSELWFLLILSTVAVSLAESKDSDETLSPSDLRSPVFAQADNIYKKQIECESIIGAAVNKVLDEGTPNKFPVPDDEYVECKKSLDEKKRAYIKTALVGLNYYATFFPMRLSNGRVLFLPTPTEKTPTAVEEGEAEFDVQEELCATNQVCLTISKNKHSRYDSDESNKLTQRFSHCTDILEELKINYIKVNKLDENKLKKERGLTVKCSQGALTFFLPKPKNSKPISSATTLSETPKGKTVSESVEVKESSANKSIQSQNSNINPYKEGVKELNALYEKKAKDEETEQESLKVMSPSELTAEEAPVQGKAEMKASDSEFESFSQNESGAETGDSTTVNQNIAETPESEVPSSDKILDEEATKDEPNDDNDTSTTTENNVGAKQDNEKDSSKNDRQTSPSNGTAATNGKEKSIKTKSGKNKSSDKNVELVTYRVNVSKKEDGKIIKIQASGRIKKIESGNKTPKLQALSAVEQGSKSQDQTETGLGITDVAQDHGSKRRHPESLEDSIVIMETDCKELLQFGEQLLIHKMLSSLVNFENQYNECIRKLNKLKKMYIEKQQLDVTSHKTIFPLTLPSGVQKLLWLPTQFLKTDLVDALSTSNFEIGNAFEVVELDSKHEKLENSVLQNREPFDDPAFIPNEEFLESLQERSTTSESSTLSKVASMLHINGGNLERKIAE